MRVGEAAHAAAVTVRALRYYEKLGLIAPARSANAYRDYDAVDVLLVKEIRALTDLGLSVAETRPFLECLLAGHDRGDVCPESLAAYRRAIEDLTRRIGELEARRTTLAACLDAAVGLMPVAEAAPPSAAPIDDAGPPQRLAGRRLPPLELRSTAGERVRLCEIPGRTVVYLYPLTGRPGVDLPAGWDTIPGARGCTAEACGFRDHHGDLLQAGARAVFGLSSQDTAYQREVVQRLRLPFAMLSDERLELAGRLGLPTFTADERRLFRRLTLIIRDGVVEDVFYPVGEPAAHAEEVLRWLTTHP